MANYRNLHVKIWSDPQFESLSPNSKLIFIYLLTNVHRSESGLYNISLSKISFETKLPINKLKNSIYQLCQSKLVEYDSDKSVIWIKNIIKYQNLSPNCIKSIENDLKYCSSEVLRQSFGKYYLNYPKLEGACKGLINPSKNPSIGTGIGIGIGIESEEPFFEKAIPEYLKKKEGFIEAWKQWKYMNDTRGTSLIPAMVNIQLAYLREQPDPVFLLTQATGNNWKGLIYDQKKDSKSEKPKVIQGKFI